jgi:WD40 repeat protein
MICSWKRANEIIPSLHLMTLACGLVTDNPLAALKAAPEGKMHNENLFKVRFTIVASVFALASLATIALGQATSSQPMLRIETGMHATVIRRIGVDAANRYLVTASEDKTARVWELATGRLLRVLRPPIGEGNEGKLHAVAISPDGRIVAVGGWTSPDGLNTDIYFFDRESGRLVRRITGMPNVTFHLVFSRDGRWLAATLFGKNGIRVYETTRYTQVGEDRDYGSDSYGADFDATGRLVTSCFDGYIRIYDRTSNGALRLAAKRKQEGSEHPYGVSFTPDGSAIAVGFEDTIKVAVLSSRDLSLRFAPNISGATNGNLICVAWSADGRTLSAGGTSVNSQGIRIIRQWAEGGLGPYRDIVAAQNTILHILPLRDGGIVYGTSDPAFGYVDARGQRSLFTGPAIADHRDNLQAFMLSSDGMVVQFGYETFGRSPARFSISDRRLEDTISNTTALTPPTTAGLAITDWQNSYAPKLNGQTLKLQQYEISRSLAIAPDQSRFLLGAEFWLRLFDRQGKELWVIAIPSSAWSVNISGDGRFAVAAFGDGTIRWYQMTDGKLLLSFFPHNDRKRWVVWTPSGYYDTSPGAEELIGWHVNNGREATADFFPVAQFRNVYYRPDVIARVLQTGDEWRALELANEEAGRKRQQADIAAQLPPVVEIISPSDGSEVPNKEVTVRFRIRTPSGEPVTNVKALVDGRPIGARALSVVTSSEGVREMPVTLSEGDSTISVIAENRFNASVPATVRLKLRGAGAATATSAVIIPKLYVLAVGVSKYANEKFNLNFSDKDARDFVSTMMAQKGFLYREVIVKSLLNERATKDEILDGLDWIRKETTSNDVAMIFFSGHGVNDQNNYYYFCPYNVDPERLLRTGVAFSDIKNTVSAIAGKALFFVDTCHSGNSIGMAGRRGGLDINIVINELSSAQNGVVVFSASTGSESSYERPEWNNGAFTKALIEGLNGAADFLSKGRITYTMLNVYVTERVKELTRGQQHPTMISPNTVPDFPIAVKK